MDLSTIVIDGKITRRIWDDPVLSTVCDEVASEDFGPELVRLGELMLDNILNPPYGEKGGVGLAAPQIGLSKRMFVVTFPRDNDATENYVVVNPVLTINTESRKIRVPGEGEGCLSIPSIYQQVERFSLAKLTYQDAATGERKEMPLSGFDAIIAQHEFDHLDGIMFFDRRRMPKNLNKDVLRRWDKVKSKYGK